MKRFNLLIIVALSLSSCKDDPTPATDFGYDYLPLEVGHWVEYEVDSIVFDAFTAEVDTYSFRLRDEIVETFTDLDSREVYRVEQSYVSGLDPDLSYSFRISYTLIIDGVRVERLDNNLKTVPLVFPPRLGSTWDGNAFNTLDEANYAYDYVDATSTLSSGSIDSSLRVIQDQTILSLKATARKCMHVALA